MRGNNLIETRSSVNRPVVIDFVFMKCPLTKNCHNGMDTLFFFSGNNTWIYLVNQTKII